MRFQRAVDEAQTTARCSLIVQSILSQRAVDSEASCGRSQNMLLRASGTLLSGLREPNARAPREITSQGALN